MMMGFRKLTGIALITLSLIVAFNSCKPKKTELSSPPGYNFQQETTFKLDMKLKEISGLVWETENNEFICHNDEKGSIFFLDRQNFSIKRTYHFAGKGDYEDIAVVGKTPYVLKSDGVITKVIMDKADSAHGEEVGKLNIDGSADFETMYFDSTRNALIIICKNCKIDDKGTVSAFAFHLDSTGFDPKPVYTIDAEKIKELSPKETSKFQPSCARIHPVTKKLFIISSASNLLVIADQNGTVESVHWLKPKMFPQPEGLTFKSNGEMFISNEGVTSNATILRFEYTKPLNP